MSNNSQQDNSSNQPLFQNMDAQERALSGDTDGDQIDRESVVGSEGRFETPTIPAQSSFGASTNMPVPPTALPDLLTNSSDEERIRE
jgi:hypothetical protein